MFDDFKDWLIDLIKKIFEPVWNFLKDVVIFIFELLLKALAALIDLIPLPDFLTNGISSIVATFPPLLLYMMEQTGVNQMLLIFSSAVIFRLARKALTLGQW